MTNWRWKNFTRDELKCKGTGTFVINEDALDKLQDLRNRVGVPLVINSAYRSPEYNKKVGGAKDSMHVQGRAFDISIKGLDPRYLYICAKEAGFTGFGFYRTFLHVDTGTARSWGGYKDLYLMNGMKNSISIPPRALSIEKETEAPHKIEGKKLSDKQKIAASGVGIAGAGAAIDLAVQATPVINAASYLSWQTAVALIAGIIIVGGIWYLLRRKK